MSSCPVTIWTPGSDPTSAYTVSSRPSTTFQAVTAPTAPTWQDSVCVLDPVPGFSPADLDGLEQWFKADTGVTKDVNNKVSVWNDQSGNGFHARQTTAIYQPTYEAIGDTAFLGGPPPNFTPGILFDSGSLEHMFFNYRPHVSFPDFTVIIAMRERYRGSDTCPIGNIHSAAFNLGTFIQTGSDIGVFAGYTDFDDGSSYVFDLTYQQSQPGNWHLMSRTRQADDFGAFEANWSGGSNGVTYLQFSGGAQWVLGRMYWDQIANEWDGWIYEVIIYNRFITENERLQLRTYLESKYPLTF